MNWHLYLTNKSFSFLIQSLQLMTILATFNTPFEGLDEKLNIFPHVLNINLHYPINFNEGEDLNKEQNVPQSRLKRQTEYDINFDDYGSKTEVPSPQEKRIIVPGDVILGGLFQIHHSLPGTLSGCDGHIKGEKGIQRMEAMLFAVDQINRNPHLLPGIKVGVDIADTCSMDTIAMSQCMPYIYANELNNAVPETNHLHSPLFDAKNYRCEKSDELELLGDSGQDKNRRKTLESTPNLVPPRLLVAVIGPSSSQETSLVAGIFHAFKIPQIGYAATSYELSQKSKYEYFSRVVPPDNYQARAMVDIVKAFNWTYVSIVAAEGLYGKKGIEAFENLAKESGVCVAMSYFLDSIPTEGDFDKVIKALLEKNLARGVITFMDEENLRGLLKASVRAKTVGHFVWLGSDSWGAKVTPVKELEIAAEGAITLLPKKNNVESFDHYFTSLNLASNQRNIWFAEYLESHLNCTLRPNHAYDIICSEKEILEGMNDFEQEGLIPFVIDAVYLAAHALHNLLETKCGKRYKGLCQNARTIKSWEILPFIRNSAFVGTQGDKITLDQNGDVKGRYSIYQFQKMEDKGYYKYVLIGEWIENLDLNTNLIKWKRKSGPNSLPDSVCSYPCDPGYIIRFDVQQKCCWVCLKCGPNEYTSLGPLASQSSSNLTTQLKDIINSSVLNTTINYPEPYKDIEDHIIMTEDYCIPCPTGYVLDETLRNCKKLPITYLKWSDAWAIIPTCLAVAGLIGTLVVIIIFVRHNDSLVVAGSCPELCYLILMGLVMCYTMTLILLSKPSTPSCTAIKLGLGTSLTLFYATLFIKILYMHQHFGEKPETENEQTIIPAHSFLSVPFGNIKGLKNNSAYHSDDLSDESFLGKVTKLNPNFSSSPPDATLSTKPSTNSNISIKATRLIKQDNFNKGTREDVIQNLHSRIDDISPQQKVVSKKNSTCFAATRNNKLCENGSDLLSYLDNTCKTGSVNIEKTSKKSFSFKKHSERSQKRFVSLPVLRYGKHEALSSLESLPRNLSLKKFCRQHQPIGNGRWANVARKKDKIIASRIRFSIDSTHSKVTRKERATKKKTKKFVSFKLPQNPKALILVCVVIVLFHALGLIVWLIIEPTGIWIDYSFSREAILRCAASNFSIVLSLMFNMIQICLATVWAFKTRNVTQNFNEAKFITFAMYSTCVVWLAFIPIFLGTDNDFRIQTSTLSMCLAISAWVALGMFFAPKIYIILFQSRKNLPLIKIPPKYVNEQGSNTKNNDRKVQTTTTIAKTYKAINNSQNVCLSSVSEEIKDVDLSITYTNDKVILEGMGSDCEMSLPGYISPKFTGLEANTEMGQSFDTITLSKSIRTAIIKKQRKTSIHANIRSEAEIEI